jgi:hypothetical protein
MQQWVPDVFDASLYVANSQRETLLCYGLWCHLGAELLNTTLVHNVGTTKESAMDRMSIGYR